MYVVYVSRLAGCYHRWDANNSAWKISPSEKLCIARISSLLDREIKKRSKRLFQRSKKIRAPVWIPAKVWLCHFTFASGVILETRVQGSENNNYGGRRRGRICRLLRVIVDFWRRKSKLSPPLSLPFEGLLIHSIVTDDLIITRRGRALEGIAV